MSALTDTEGLKNVVELNLERPALANRIAFAALAFLVWPARRRVLQRAVCHLAARIDNNAVSKF